MRIINKLIKFLEAYMDDLPIKKKFLSLYILCVLVPLIITDSVVLFIVGSKEQERQYHEMANIASATGYSLASTVQNAGEIAKSIYTNKNVNSFLEKQYDSTTDFFIAYRSFFQDTILENALGMNQITFTMYTDNDTIVSGGKVDHMSKMRKTKAYKEWVESGNNSGLFFVYDHNGFMNSNQRKIVLLQNLNFYSSDNDKMLKIEFDYNSITRMLKKMNYDNEILVCDGEQIVLSNGSYGGAGKDFMRLGKRARGGYKQTISVYGTQLDVYVLKRSSSILDGMARYMPGLSLLVFINVVLPMGFVVLLNQSFTKRIQGLSKVFKSVNSEYLVLMPHENGKDEIGSMIRNYNRMVKRTNELIQTVYKNRIREQEIMVGRKNAELLALQSQINPHFLFNALESIRMHSILKQETETADMVEKLAIMQRQYVDWGNDSVTIRQEIDFIKAYLSLQKYRFGERLNYDLDVEPDCLDYRIPKLTVVTFVENACVHGIESKSSPGWIFVRIYSREELLCIEVEDTGCGMDEQQINEIQYDMKNANLDMLKSKRSVGMVNACLRLRMSSEDQASFEIDGEEGTGTLIMIRIPLKYV